MLVTFLRHADAEDEVTTDHARRLTAKGLEQAGKVGRLCVRTGLVPDLILSSPLVRAEQTARVISQHLDDREVVIERWLACGMSPQSFLESLAAYARFSHVMVVGHEPDFSAAISACIGLGDSSRLVIRKSSLTAVDLPRLRPGSGRLEFTLPSRLM